MIFRYNYTVQRHAQQCCGKGNCALEKVNIMINIINCLQCTNDSQNQRDNVLQFIKMHPFMDAAVKQEGGHPMYHQGGAIFRNIAVDTIGDHKVFFLGTGM